MPIGAEMDEATKKILLIQGLEMARAMEETERDWEPMTEVEVPRLTQGEWGILQAFIGSPGPFGSFGEIHNARHLISQNYLEPDDTEGQRIHSYRLSQKGWEALFDKGLATPEEGEI